MTKASHAATRLTLAQQRSMTSLMEIEIAAASADMVFDKSDWVPLYFDLGQKVTSDCGEMSAFRALTLQGQFLWMVFTPSKVHGYHAACDDPFEAMELAQAAWNHRREVRQDWTLVEQTARDLLWGRQRFWVTIEDVKASPLCTLGCDGFRNAIGLGRIKRIPGWLAAALMKIEPQMGFVIHAAMVRRTQAGRAGQAAVPATA